MESQGTFHKDLFELFLKLEKNLLPSTYDLALDDKYSGYKSASESDPTGMIPYMSV